MKPQTQIGSFLRAERQKQGYSQKKLAESAACSPSALCMFEKGKADALSPERLNKICEVLGLNEGALMATASQCFCPSEYCPSHNLYELGNGQQVLNPNPVEAATGTHCIWCGTPYLSTCDHCGAPYSGNGAFCPQCGTAYIQLSEGRTIQKSAYANFKIIQFNQSDNSRTAEGGVS